MAPMSTTHPCSCPPTASKRCTSEDVAFDDEGRSLCCPYDDEAMARYFGIDVGDVRAGRRSSMRKRLDGELNQIAQRAADTRRYGKP